MNQLIYFFKQCCQMAFIISVKDDVLKLKRSKDLTKAHTSRKYRSLSSRTRPLYQQVNSAQRVFIVVVCSPFPPCQSTRKHTKEVIHKIHGLALGLGLEAVIIFIP